MSAQPYEQQRPAAGDVSQSRDAGLPLVNPLLVALAAAILLLVILLVAVLLNPVGADSQPDRDVIAGDTRG